MDCSPPGSSVHGDSPRQEYWSGLPCPPPGDLPNPGIKPRSPALQVDSLPTEPQRKPMKEKRYQYYFTSVCPMHAKSLQSCPTLCDPMDCNPPGDSVHGDSPGKNTGVGCHFS